ncbi:IS200/IS605 family transposase [Rhodohalobacter barkolensis]|uniref:Transposase n=1 Tax=Rhodohalobacter barkolensis TaxID=2053187 RepID=A0A2N0VEW0_9BACT|nr:IS200/IS605 family transposase [Rhodohalobacter barkolensis]PKD42729.1 transposase [Rhodohalobacter barkolensis]
MSQSLSKLYIHLIFSTKGRQPLIPRGTQSDLHSYMAGIFIRNESPAIIINSVPDHLHVLFRLSKNMALAGVVEQVKKSTSKWMKERTGSSSFFWQRGYGAFSVSSSKVDLVARYIARQEEHHKHMGYREEIERFMKEYDVIEYNTDYFWN